MNRTIIYDEEQGRTFDVLWGWRDAMIALGFLEPDMGGSTAAVVAGLQATATGPASLSINLAQGRIYQQSAVDSTSYGALSSDSDIIQQQGFAAAQQVTLTASGLSSGQSQWALIEAQFSQSDVVRPGDPNGGVLLYFNAANPSQPFQGPNNSGQVQPSERLGVMTIKVIYGSPATTGSEVPPQPETGWVGLYLVDLTFGQTTIVQGNILKAAPSVGTGVPSNYPYAPFIGGLFNQHHLGQGSGQAPQIDLTAEVKNTLPLSNLPASNTTGGGIAVFKQNAGNPNGSVAGHASVNGTQDFCYDTTNFLLYACTTAGTAGTASWTAVVGQSTSIFAGGVSTGSANAQVVASTIPAGFARTPGQVVTFTAGFTNSGAATLNVDATGAAALNKNLGAGNVPLTGGEIVNAAFISVIWTGSVYLLQAQTLGALATLGIGQWLKNDGSGNLTVKNGLALADDGAGLLTVAAGGVLPAMLSAAGAPLAQVAPTTTQGAGNLTMSNDGSSPNTVVDVAIGRVRDDGDTVNMQLIAGMTKRLDQSWASGTGNGGCDASTKGINQTWHAYIIGHTGMAVTNYARTSNVASLTIPGHNLGVGGTIRCYGLGLGFDGIATITAVTSTTVNYSNTGGNLSITAAPATALADGFDLLFSQSYPTPTYPTGYNVKQCLGSVLTDASTNIIGFLQQGDEFTWVTPILDLNSNTTLTSTLRTLSVPTGVKVRASLLASFAGGTGAGWGGNLYLTSPDVTDQAQTNQRASVGAVGALSGGAGMTSDNFVGEANVFTNTSAQIRSNASASNISILTRGWRDPRRRLF